MDLYIVLGLEREATLDEIKRAYRRLARRYHPDINPGDRMAAAQFRTIAEAYETLSDPDRRRRYDATRGRRRPPKLGAAGFEGFDFSVSVSGASASTFGELFADVLLPRDVRVDHRRSRARRRSASDVARRASRMRFAAGRTSWSSLGRSTARTCRGLGRLRTAESRCPQCHGTGVLKAARGHMVFSKPCTHCGGTGRHADVRCPRVRRPSGRSRVRETLTIESDARARRRRARPRAGQRARGRERRRGRRSLRRRSCRAASALQP